MTIDREDDERIAELVVEKLEQRLMSRFYETVGKSFIKKLLGLLLVGVGSGALVLAVKLGVIKI